MRGERLTAAATRVWGGGDEDAWRVKWETGSSGIAGEEEIDDPNNIVNWI